MNDLFRAIFGIPLNKKCGERMSDQPTDDFSGSFKGNGGSDDDDDEDDENEVNLRTGSRGGIFGIPLFSDPSEIHRHLDKLVDEMSKVVGIFGFGSGPSLTWDDGSSNNDYQTEPKQERLRDAYLKKPDCACDKVNQKDDFGLNIMTRSPSFEQGTSGTSNSIQICYPKVYSKSVFIQTVRRPDGSVETIKKVRDHEGNEETTISQKNVNDPHSPPSDVEPMPNQCQKEDTSGISIFKKFFSF